MANNTRPEKLEKILASIRYIAGVTTTDAPSWEYNLEDLERYAGIEMDKILDTLGRMQKQLDDQKAIRTTLTSLHPNNAATLVTGNKVKIDVIATKTGHIRTWLEEDKYGLNPITFESIDSENPEYAIVSQGKNSNKKTEKLPLYVLQKVS